MASLSICSSTITTRPSHNLAPTLFFSKSNFSSLSLAPSLSPIRLASPKTPSFSFVPKSTGTDAPVIEAEEEKSAEDTSLVVESATEEPKPKTEEVFAVVMIGGRQYIVFPGRFLYTQRLKGAKKDDKVVLNKVLLVGTKTSTYLGQPLVPNAAVHAVVEEQGLNKKVIVFKYKKKKNYRRNIGHRQPNTRIKITGITGYKDSPAITLSEIDS